jgi:hypothetical protein
VKDSELGTKELPMSVRNRLAWRAALAVAAWISVAPFATGEAQAQAFQGPAPWCANMGDLGIGFECAYYTLEQCLARVSGITNSCSVNPWYVPERIQVRRQRRDPREYR